MEFGDRSMFLAWGTFSWRRKLSLAIDRSIDLFAGPFSSRHDDNVAYTRYCNVLLDLFAGPFSSRHDGRLLVLDSTRLYSIRTCHWFLNLGSVIPASAAAHTDACSLPVGPTCRA